MNSLFILSFYLSPSFQIKGNNLLVYMVDYGNLFNVSLKDSRELHESFYTFPKHSIECCLHDVTLGATYTDWLPAAINFFKAQTGSALISFDFY